MLEYVKKALVTPIDLYTTLPYKIYLFPDYSKDHSIMLTCVHHSFQDGLCWLSTKIAMSDDKDFSVLPLVTTPSMLTMLLAEVTSIGAVFRTFINFLSITPHNNCFRQNTEQTPTDRAICISPDLKREDFSERCKQVGCTFNNATKTLLGMAFKQYAERHGQPELASLTLSSTFSLKAPPRSEAELIAGNHWVSRAYDIPLGHDFDQLLKINKRISKEQAAGFNLIAQKNFLKLVMSLPESLQLWALKRMQSGVDFRYSNVPHLKKNTVVNGVETLSEASFAASMPNQVNCILINSYTHILKIGLTTSQTQVKDPDDLMKCIVAEFYNFMYPNG